MRRNSVIALLAALILLGCATAPRHAAAETRPLNIKSLYNMSEEDSMRKVKVEDIITILFRNYGKSIILPVLFEAKKIVSDSSYISDDDSFISRSEINESFSNSKYPDGITISVDTNILREISSNEIVFVIYEQYGERIILENEDYFKHFDIERFEKTGETGFSNFLFLNYFIDEIKHSFPNSKKELDSEITVKEVKEVMEKAYPRYYWPLEEISTEKNTKLVLPQYTEEFLNSKEYLENKNIFGILIRETSKTNEKYKFFLYHIVETPTGGYKFYDLITGEEVEVSIKNNKNKNYFKNKGIEFPFYDSHTFKIGAHTNFGTKQFTTEDIKMHDLVIKMGTAETIGELLEMYSYLPEGYEPDYSSYDFSANPHVDPAWLAGQRRALRPGDRGEAVLAMKQRFYELGYFRTEKFNDQYTQNTADTVRLFEKNNNLPQDGVADAEMLALLYSDKAVGK